MSFGETGNELPQALADAIRRRLRPNTNLTHKQLAYALRCSERTIWNLLNGNNAPSGDTLWQLCQFFGVDFIGELFGCHVVRISDRRALEAMKMIEEGRKRLKEVLG